MRHAQRIDRLHRKRHTLRRAGHSGDAVSTEAEQDDTRCIIAIRPGVEALRLLRVRHAASANVAIAARKYFIRSVLFV